MVKKRLLIIVMHIVIWILFLSLPALFKPHTEHLTLANFVDYFFHTPRLINGGFLVLVFYLNYLLLIPRLFFRKRFSYFILTIIIATGLFICISTYLIVGVRKHSELFEHDTLFNLFMFICVYFFAFALSYYDQWKRDLKRLNVEVAFLKAQINPHFLFNTLNSIYSLALTKSDNTSGAVVKLSAIMRYSLTDSQKQYVNLAEEIAYISNYTDLQRLRLTENVKVETIYEGDFKTEKIGPMLLIPFIENAFKHGVSPEEESDIKIHIGLNDRVLKFTVINNKVYIQKSGGNIGHSIKNTRQRLALLYPNNYKLAIRENVETFEVNLQIDLS